MSSNATGWPHPPFCALETQTHLTPGALDCPDPLSLKRNSAAPLHLCRINQPANNYCCYGVPYPPPSAEQNHHRHPRRDPLSIHCLHIFHREQRVYNEKDKDTNVSFQIKNNVYNTFLYDLLFNLIWTDSFRNSRLM